MVPKDEEAPPIKVWKKWTGQLVVNYLCHDEIEEAVKESGIKDPHQRIAQWAKAVSDKYNSLTDEEKTKYGVIAEQWTNEGPPAEVRQRLVSILNRSSFTR